MPPSSPGTRRARPPQPHTGPQARALVQRLYKTRLETPGIGRAALGSLDGQGPPGACYGTLTAEHRRQAQPAPPSPRRPHTFFAVHDRGASACTRRDRSRRATSAKERPSPDAPQSPWVTAQTTLVAVGRRRKRSLHAASAGSCVRRGVPSAAHTSGPCAPSPWRACGRARSCSSARFRPRSLCRTYFRSVSWLLQRPRTCRARSPSRACFQCARLWSKPLSAYLCCVVLAWATAGARLAGGPRVPMPLSSFPCTLMPSACAGCVAPGDVGLCLSFPLSRMRVVLHASQGLRREAALEYMESLVTLLSRKVV